MKIAYIIPSLSATGPVIVVRNLVDVMTRDGHYCKVYYFDKKDENLVEFINNTSVEMIPERGDKIDFTPFDTVHSHGYRPDRYVARYREYSGKVLYVSTIHNYIFEDLKYQYNSLVSAIFGRKWLKFLQRMDKVVALSNDALHYYQKWIDNQKLYYCYNTRIIDTTEKLDEKLVKEVMEFKNGSSGVDNHHLIGINALLTPRKGVDIVIKALPMLPDFKLFVVGDGKQRRKLEKLARKLGVDSRCKFTGYRANSHLYLPYYDIFALPSRSEGFPLTLLEAAIYGKVCVASDLPVIEECFESTLEIFPLSQPRKIVNSIMLAANNGSFGKAINRKFITSYNEEKFFEAYKKVYQKQL
ncbi:MAG: glycosyltransferase family 4 protein [Rikenellaceae bacterium]